MVGVCTILGTLVTSAAEPAPTIGADDADTWSYIPTESSDVSSVGPEMVPSQAPIDGSRCDDVGFAEVDPVAGFGAYSTPEPWDYVRKELRFHHSSVDGRSFGEPPIHGTSWLNRPYHVGVSAGGFFMTQGVQDDVRNDNDLFGAIHLGWDWDHYWGLETRIGRATPEMINRNAPSAARNDALLITDISLLYYPQGDTVVRPYLRAGLGWTDFDYPNDAGNRTEASPFTIPFGMGVKWPVKRWLAARLELLDNMSFADSAVKMQHNFTLVVGMEYRWGAKPDTYWPWNSSWHQR